MAVVAMTGAPSLQPDLTTALTAAAWPARETALGGAMLRLAGLYRDLNLPGDFTASVLPYVERPHRVVKSGQIAAAIFEAIEEPPIRSLARVGAVDQFVESTPVLTSAERGRAIGAAAFRPG